MALPPSSEEIFRASELSTHVRVQTAIKNQCCVASKCCSNSTYQIAMLITLQVNANNKESLLASIIRQTRSPLASYAANLVSMAKPSSYLIAILWCVKVKRSTNSNKQKQKMAIINLSHTGHDENACWHSFFSNAKTHRRSNSELWSAEWIENPRMALTLSNSCMCR